MTSIWYYNKMDLTIIPEDPLNLYLKHKNADTCCLLRIGASDKGLAGDLRGFRFDFKLGKIKVDARQDIMCWCARIVCLSNPFLYLDQPGC